MEDLSHIAVGSLSVTSQAGGNMMSGRPKAMSAPGSQPVDPLPPADEQGDPDIEMGPEMPAGTDGKPEPAAYTPTARQWRKPPA